MHSYSLLIVRCLIVGLISEHWTLCNWQTEPIFRGLNLIVTVAISLLVTGGRSTFPRRLEQIQRTSWHSARWRPCGSESFSVSPEQICVCMFVCVCVYQVNVLRLPQSHIQISTSGTGAFIIFLTRSPKIGVQNGFSVPRRISWRCSRKYCVLAPISFTVLINRAAIIVLCHSLGRTASFC